jgi:uncharacterized protein (TIGR02118 family)
MYKLTVVYDMPSDPDSFRAHYRDTHIPLVRALPGVRRINYSFDLESLGEEPAPFCLFEAWFDDAAALGAAMTSPEGERTAADVSNFSDALPLMFHGPATEV